MGICFYTWISFSRWQSIHSKSPSWHTGPVLPSFQFLAPIFHSLLFSSMWSNPEDVYEPKISFLVSYFLLSNWLSWESSTYIYAGFHSTVATVVNSFNNSFILHYPDTVSGHICPRHWLPLVAKCKSYNHVLLCSNHFGCLKNGKENGDFWIEMDRTHSHPTSLWECLK